MGRVKQPPELQRKPRMTISLTDDEYMVAKAVAKAEMLPLGTLLRRMIMMKGKAMGLSYVGRE